MSNDDWTATSAVQGLGDARQSIVKSGNFRERSKEHLLQPATHLERRNGGCQL